MTRAAMKVSMNMMVGYHGTTSEDADKIMEGNFIPSRGANQWLGEGVYFFADYPPSANGHREAIKWVTKFRKSTRWAILKSDIETNNQFDLVSNEKDKDEFRQISASLRRKHVDLGRSEDSFRVQAVFMYIDRERKYSSYVAFTNPSGKPTYIILDLQVQVCVKDLRVIKTKEIVNSGMV